MDSREINYSGLDFDAKLIEKEGRNYYQIFFKKELMFEVEHFGDITSNPPILGWYLNGNLNYYLEKPFVTAGGYNNCDLYTIDGNKLTNLKLWSLVYSPTLFDGKLYFSGINKKNNRGVVDSEGNTVIPFEYESLSIVFKMSACGIESNGLLYVRKKGLYGVIDLNNNIVHPFTESWNEIAIKRLKDLNLFDENVHAVVDGVLYDKKYAPKN
jgi:hypothetical protein